MSHYVIATFDWLGRCASRPWLHPPRILALQAGHGWSTSCGFFFNAAVTVAGLLGPAWEKTGAQLVALVAFCGLGAWWSAIQLWQVEEVGRKSTRGCRPGTRQHPFFEKLSHYLSVSRRVECPMKCP